MARRVRSDFESRGNRLKRRPRRKPFNAARLGRGLLFFYRRNRGNGAWILKASDGREVLDEGLRPTTISTPPTAN